MEYFSPITIAEILQRLSNDFFSFQPQEKRTASTKKSGVRLLDIEVLTEENLIIYLQNRGIKREISEKCCQQIGYTNANKYYKSIGFKNISGGYELRGEGFKSCIAPKDISFINNGKFKLSIFEGFMDFLSYLMLPEFEVKDCNYLILNSLSFINRIDEVVNSHSRAYLFLDNDTAGLNAATKLKKRFPIMVDMSIFYSDNKDLNDFLTLQQQKYG